MNSLVAAAVADPATGTYLHWGAINIGLTNALIILAMILVFVLAILLPFPGASGDGHNTSEPDEP